MTRSTSSHSHAEHDELLIARLYGDDVSEAERERAIERVATCAECAALYADLASIAAATAAARAPRRPRDFTLTPVQAARLRPARRFGAFAGWARPLGAALSAIGAVALAFVAVTSMLPSATPTGTAQFNGSDRGAGAAASQIAVATQAPGFVCAPDCGPGTSTTGDSSIPSAAATGAASQAPAASAEHSPLVPQGPEALQTSAGGGKVAEASGGHAVPTYAPAPPPSPEQAASSTFDARVAFAAAAALLVVAGLALLAGGFVASRMRR